MFQLFTSLHVLQQVFKCSDPFSNENLDNVRSFVDFASRAQLVQAVKECTNNWEEDFNQCAKLLRGTGHDDEGLKAREQSIQSKMLFARQCICTRSATAVANKADKDDCIKMLNVVKTISCL